MMIPFSSPSKIVNIKGHYVLLFNLTSMQFVFEGFLNSEQVREPLILALNFRLPPEDITELIVLREPIYPVAVDKFGVVVKNIQSR